MSHAAGPWAKVDLEEALGEGGPRVPEGDAVQHQRRVPPRLHPVADGGPRPSSGALDTIAPIWVQKPVSRLEGGNHRPAPLLREGGGPLPRGGRGKKRKGGGGGKRGEELKQRSTANGRLRLSTVSLFAQSAIHLEGKSTAEKELGAALKTPKK